MKIYIATSKSQQSWGAEVGLGKNLYKIGIAEDPAAAVVGLSGFDDWKILAAQDCDAVEGEAIARLARKEKLVDPNYYPKLKGAVGVFKIDQAHIQNAMLVNAALEGKEPPKGLKVKPADVATFMIRNAIS